MTTVAEPRVLRSGKQDQAAVGDARSHLASWLRAGRVRKQLSIEDVARITKIQPKILDKLESGRYDGLPAEVFVRGFVRSFARCVGLDETEALERYNGCGGDPPLAAKVFVETLMPMPVAVPVPVTVVEEPPVVVAAPVEPVAVPSIIASKKKRRRRSRKKKVTRSPAITSTIVAPDLAQPRVEAAPVEPIVAPEPELVVAPTFAEGTVTEGATHDSGDSGPIAVEPAETVEPAATWQPTMPPLPTTSSPPWRRSRLITAPPPSLVIDDADPDSAEREQAERAAAVEPQRVSFLPPILLDREDRSARQGGLTLAVIILLVAATLTLSYLMRRPSVTGDGMTMVESSSLIA